MPSEKKFLLKVSETFAVEHFLYIELEEFHSQLALPADECPAKRKSHPPNVKLSIIQDAKGSPWL